MNTRACIAPWRKKSIMISTVVLIFIAELPLMLSANASAQTYWDAIFEIGYDSMSQRVNPVLACDRLDRIFRLNTLVSDHLIIDEKLRLKIQASSLFGRYIYEFLS